MQTMNMSQIRNKADYNRTLHQEQQRVLLEAYDSVLPLARPYLPRDCQIEILRMLIRLPLPLIHKQSRNDDHHQNQKGFIVKLLPEAKKVHRRPGRLSQFEKQFYELRESFSIDFNFSYLGNIKSDCLLHFVVAFGTEENYEKFITLASLQADVDSQKYHRLAIYIAFKYRNTNLITYFLKYMKTYLKEAVDQNLLSTMLGFAAEFGYVHIVREITEDCNKCNPAFEENYAIKEAAKRGHLDVVKYLMSLDSKYGIDPAARGNLAIRNAATEGHLDVVKYLMSLDSKYGIKPAAFDNKAIGNAARGGHLHVVKYLMSLDSKYGIDPAAEDNQAIRDAAWGGHLHVVKYLMSLDSKYGIDPAARGNLAIRNAATEGHLDVVKYLMSLDSKYGIGPAACNNEAIRNAATEGHLDVLKYFVEEVDSKYGIDPAACDNLAITYAVEEKHKDVVEYLMGLDPKYGTDRSIGSTF